MARHFHPNEESDGPPGIAAPVHPLQVCPCIYLYWQFLNGTALLWVCRRGWFLVSLKKKWPVFPVDMETFFLFQQLLILYKARIRLCLSFCICSWYREGNESINKVLMKVFLDVSKLFHSTHKFDVITDLVPRKTLGLHTFHLSKCSVRCSKSEWLLKTTWDRSVFQCSHF